MKINKKIRLRSMMLTFKNLSVTMLDEFGDWFLLQPLFTYLTHQSL